MKRLDAARAAGREYYTKLAESLQPGTVSLMPKGFATLPSPQELADLVAFLGNAK